jgi:hypothetical protein
VSSSWIISELESGWKVQFEVFSWHLPRGTGKFTEKVLYSLCLTQDLNQAPTEYKSRGMLFEPACLFSIMRLMLCNEQYTKVVLNGIFLFEKKKKFMYIQKWPRPGMSNFKQVVIDFLMPKLPVIYHPSYRCTSL